MGKIIEKLKCVENDKIIRGKFYWAAIPYTEERPLYIFKTINDAKFTGKKTKEDASSFNGMFSEEEKRRKSEIIDVIVRHKRRLVLIIQNQEYNSNQSYNFVYVVPITTFENNSSKLKFFKEHNDIPHFHYIGQATNKESVANIGDIKRIHKSLLLESTNYKSLSEKLINDICKKIGTLMEIGELEKCKECMYNYIKKDA